MASWVPVIAGLLLPPSHAATTSYSKACKSRISDADADGVRSVRITCSWPEISPESVEALFDRYDGYHRFVWALSATSVRRTEGERVLVWQLQEVAGSAPRESLVWIQGVDNVHGSRTYTWRTAADEPLALTPGSVRATRNDGRWEIIPAAQGIDVVFEIAYSPGGWVPDWLVRWCQTLGAELMMNEIRQLAVEA